MGQALGQERAVVTKESLAEWFHQMKQYLDAMDSTLLKHLGRIFNSDESGFSICPKTKKIISRTGGKHVYSITNSTQQQVTVLACSSAVGQYIPPLLPLLIFTYTRDPCFNALEGLEDALPPPPPPKKNPMDGLPKRSFSASWETSSFPTWEKNDQWCSLWMVVPVITPCPSLFCLFLMLFWFC